MTAITRGLAPELLEPYVDKIFFQEFAEIPTMYTQFCRVERLNKAFFDDFRFAGVGRFQVKPEGTPVQFTNVVQGLRRRETVYTFALALRITKEMRDDEQHGMITRMVRDLAAAARDSMERLGHGPVNDGFAGNVYLGLFEGDGNRRALWHTGHVPLRNTAATQSNRLNPGVALSAAGMQTALTIFDLMQSEEERFITNKPDAVLIHPSERWNAAVLFETQQAVGSADNDINPVSSSRVGLRTMSSPFLTATLDWSLWVTRGDAVRWYDRERLRTQQTMDDLTGDAIEISAFRANVGIGEWRYTVGSHP